MDTDGLSPNIKNQTHKQGACSDIQTATDTLYSESELQLVQDKLTTSFRDCFGHKRQTLKMEYYRTRNMDIRLEYAQNEKQRATWRATAEEIPAESSKCMYLSRRVSLLLFDKLSFLVSESHSCMAIKFFQDSKVAIALVGALFQTDFMPG